MSTDSGKTDPDGSPSPLILADGIGERRKIRLRIYDPGDKNAKLELKEKTGDFQRKRSLTVSREEAEQMMEGN